MDPKTVTHIVDHMYNSKMAHMSQRSDMANLQNILEP